MVLLLKRALAVVDNISFDLKHNMMLIIGYRTCSHSNTMELLKTSSIKKIVVYAMTINQKIHE